MERFETISKNSFERNDLTKEDVTWRKYEPNNKVKRDKSTTITGKPKLMDFTTISEIDWKKQKTKNEHKHHTEDSWMANIGKGPYLISHQKNANKNQMKYLYVYLPDSQKVNGRESIKM